MNDDAKLFLFALFFFTWIILILGFLIVDMDLDKLLEAIK